MYIHVPRKGNWKLLVLLRLNPAGSPKYLNQNLSYLWKRHTPSRQNCRDNYNAEVRGCSRRPRGTRLKESSYCGFERMVVSAVMGNMQVCPTGHKGQQYVEGQAHRQYHPTKMGNKYRLSVCWSRIQVRWCELCTCIFSGLQQLPVMRITYIMYSQHGVSVWTVIL